jgi:hypothetical protein
MFLFFVMFRQLRLERHTDTSVWMIFEAFLLASSGCSHVLIWKMGFISRLQTLGSQTAMPFDEHHDINGYSHHLTSLTERMHAIFVDPGYATCALRPTPLSKDAQPPPAYLLVR